MSIQEPVEYSQYQEVVRRRVGQKTEPKWEVEIKRLNQEIKKRDKHITQLHKRIAELTRKLARKESNR